MWRIGHKGAKGPDENTAPALKKALRAGADGVEFDIRMSKDGALVIFHDPKVDGFTNGSGYIKDLDFNELKQLKLNGSNEVIPSSYEVFSAIAREGKPKVMQIDLKVPGTGRQLLNQIYRFGFEDIVIISSFHKSILEEIRGLDSKIKTGLIKYLPANGPIEYLAPESEENRAVRKAKETLHRAYLYMMLPLNIISGSAFSDLIKDAKEINADYIMFWWGATTKSLVKKAHKKGLGVVVGEVNTEKRIRRMERKQVDGIVTDCAELLRPSRQ